MKRRKPKDQGVDEAAEKIVNIIEGNENELKADAVVSGATATGANLSPQNKGLKVLEEKVVKTVRLEGENGIYEAETGKGVSLANDGSEVHFETEEQLNSWVAEIKQVFSMI